MIAAYGCALHIQEPSLFLKSARIARETSVGTNHPMAGKTLNFTGKIVSVRDATEKELREGLHGEYLPREEERCCHGKGRCHKDDPDHECCHKDDPDHECCHKDDK